MEIILSIFQILGIILLVLLAILILAILLVLFVPVRYRISGAVHETITLEGKIHWLLHLLRAKFSYEDELFYVEIGILWKRIYFTKELGASEDDDEGKVDTVSVDKKKADHTGNVDSGNTVDNPENLDESYYRIDKALKETGTSHESQAEEGKKKQSFNKKIETLISTIKEKIIFIKKRATQIKKLIQDKKNQAAVKHLKDELFYFIKVLLPKKSSLKGSFSTGSPDTTGQIFGVIYCFPIIYQKTWSLTPDFEAEKAYFEGDFKGKGRIYVFQLVGILLRIIVDKNCRRLYYIIRRLGGQSNGRRK